MGLNTTFVSGVRRSGKSAVIRTMIDRLWKRKPHYIRLAQSGGDKTPPKQTQRRPQNAGVASARWLDYDAEHVFEILPAALAAIHRADPYGSVVIEADSDPVLRCAYSYDHRVFVMPVPGSIEEVFRDAAHAAEELKQALEDTVAFASEIFGMFSDGRQDDAEPPEDRPDLSETNMRGFLYSPLGDELATRIQLQPPYHGLVESDVILVNTATGKCTDDTRECLNRIERLIARLRGNSGQRTELFHCDPRDTKAKDCKRLLKALAPMCQSGS